MDQSTKIRKYEAQSFKEMAWKNGGGKTTELFITPPNASLAALDFDVRVSVATVEQSGPFSNFPEFHRTIMQLDGPPVGLIIDGAEAKTLKPLEAFRFSGESDVQCVIKGVAKDLNVFVRRSYGSADVSVVQDLKAELELESTECSLIYVLKGKGRLIHQEDELSFAEGDLLELDFTDDCRLTSSEGSSLSLVIITVLLEHSELF